MSKLRGASITDIFRAPENPDVPLWRYMDLAKYISMLLTGALYFVRADRLSDPFEGSMSRRNLELRPELYKGMGIPEEIWKKLSDFLPTARTWAFINSWHANEHESAAMWRLYSQTTEAIAIQTTFRKLSHVLPDKVYVGTVEYIDYEKHWMPEGNVFFPFLHKRLSFEHEREVRAVIMSLPTNPENHVGSPLGEYGRVVPVDLVAMIERVVVA